MIIFLSITYNMCFGCSKEQSHWDSFEHSQHYYFLVEKQENLFVCFVALCPSQQLWSWLDGQFTLPHFSLGKLEQAVNQYFVHILSLVTEENKKRFF